VTPYLTPETVFSTLRLILAMNPSNGVVFDYAVPRSSLDAFEQAALDAILKRVAAAGEPFRGFFAPEELARELRAMGYETIEDLDGEEINRRYFANRVDRLVVAGPPICFALGAHKGSDIVRRALGEQNLGDE